MITLNTNKYLTYLHLYIMQYKIIALIIKEKFFSIFCIKISIKAGL